MGLIERFRRKKPDDYVHLFRDDDYEEPDYSDLPYASEFELPREEARLRAVYDHEQAGGNFVVRKQYSNKGRATREIATLDKFPVFEELLAAVEEMYGGGTYNVCPANSQKVLKSYVIDGPPKAGNLRDGTASRTAGQTVKQRLEDQGFRELDGLLQNDTELGRILAGAMLKKQFGVDLPMSSSYEERLFQNELESNPEYRSQFLDAALKNKGVRPKKSEAEGDEFDKLITALEKAQKLRDAMGGESAGGGDSWRGIVQDAIKAGAEFFKSGGRLPSLPGGTPTPAIAQQQSIGPYPPYPVEEVQAPPRPTPDNPAPQPMPQPAPTPVRRQVIGNEEGRIVGMPNESEAQPPMGLASIDWMALLPQVNWAELETQASGDPGDFMQITYTRFYENDSEPHGILRDLFLNNTPQAIVAAFVDAGEMLNKPWVVGMARFAGKVDDIECAGRIIQRLTETPEGHHWVAEAAAAARIIEQRLVEAEANVGNAPIMNEFDEEVIEAQEVEANEEAVMDSRLTHPAQSDVLEQSDDDDDDDDDYYDVVR